MSNIESWKNKDVFNKQLELNKTELDRGYYPEHWNNTIDLIKEINPTTMLDVGCGVGSFYVVINREFKNISYDGVDYSTEAVDIAKLNWCKTCFSELNYLSLDNEYVSNYDLLYSDALLDVLPNGDEALEHFLSTKAKNILLSRVRLTNKESYHDEYYAYDVIKTYAYYHNSDNFHRLCNEYGYDVKQRGSNYWLELKTL